MIPAKARFPVAILVAALCLGTACVRDAQDEPPALPDLISKRLSELSYAPSPDWEALGAPEALFVFYRKRAFEPAWTREGLLLARAEELLGALDGAGAEGLNRADYHFEPIRRLADAVRGRNRKNRAVPVPDLADLDLYCSDSFILYATHLLRGKVDQESMEPAWGLWPGELALASYLDVSLFAEGVRDALLGLVPVHDHYNRLRRAFLTAAGDPGGWPRIKPGLPLRKGDRGGRVKTLRKRLEASGDCEETSAGRRGVFDEPLERGLRRFQDRVGLDATGVLDGASFAFLNFSRQYWTRRLTVNLERWRWLPRALGRSYILVNVADFRLDLYERDGRVLSMKIVAGNRAWPTPVFASRISQVILNPSWIIPVEVVLKETRNYILADPNYLNANKMRVLRGKGENEREIDPATVDWKSLEAGDLDFYIRQEPGPLNVLGAVKFAMRNDYEIYLHDTPYQEDFGKSVRAYSHGCIRVEKPIDLAARLLNGRNGWTPERIREAIAAGVEVRIDLAEAADVFFQYGTAWVDGDGTVEFRPDIYGSDAGLFESLGRRPPWAAGHGR